MKTILRISLATLLALASTACSKGTLINEQRDMTAATWNNFDPQLFSFTVPSTDDCYNIFVNAAIANVALRIARIPDAVLDAAAQMKPSLLADALYELAQSYSSFYHRQWLPITVRIDNPSGEHRMFRYDLKAIDEKGYWVGTPLKDGSLLIEACIRKYFFFNSVGETTIQLKQCTDRFDLHGIQAITLRIEKAKLEYPK